MVTVLAIVSALFVGFYLGFNFYRFIWAREMIGGKLHVDFSTPEYPKVAGLELDGNNKQLFERNGVVLKIVSDTGVSKEVSRK